jgi:2-amino-4-hydroxy-6-hydroxymethyldihydropteridine diphosphokinase
MPATAHVAAYVALGSNLGDRRAYLARAVAALRAHPGVARLRLSSIYETAPVGGPAGQGRYLNAAAEVITSLPPAELFRLLMAIEAECGRQRVVVDGPRTLDLDLLLYDDLVGCTPELILPHPRLHLRGFVLVPLAEIAAGVVHPSLNKTIADLLADLQGVRACGATPGRELAGLRALVTGSTSGIGAAIALAFADAAADVIVHGRRSVDAANAIARQVRARGGRSAVRLADLRSPAACLQLADESWAEWQGLDVLVCNAGADTLTGEAAGWSFERKLEELFAVDVSATVALCRSLGQRMKSAGSGVILTIGWDQAETGMEGDSGQLFGLTKGAVMAFTRSLALSLAPQVRVNCLAPGWIRTAWGESASDVWQQRVRRETPLQRWGEPQDVANLARWAVSPAASFVSGQVLRTNGGAIR